MSPSGSGSATLPPPLPVVVVLGPTAAGKSSFAMRLADIFPAEIISFDSMKVYTGMDVGTAKPSRDERARYAYHLVDVLRPSELSNAGWFVSRADEALRSVLARGRLPLVEGGTALYLKAFLQGIFDGPPRSDSLRSELLARERSLGPGTLHADLAALDPAAAARLHPNDLKRVVRAIEVARSTGTPISELQDQWSSAGLRGGFAFILIGVTRDRPALYRRIDGRVDDMILSGLLDEVRSLHASGSLGPTASQALGYRELVDHLEGRCLLDEAVRLIKRNTRRFARRQLGWFRKFHDVAWYRLDDDSSHDAAVSDAAARIASAVRTRAPRWTRLVESLQ
ncbi:MAG: tRNA (adenosine(37)-N6)-dimethylallyltransferase MiaA [Planctomycetes bacterium]|nr:tRNA (adenosine(37)-N6)-dimethylallyltransferase MiaA [Planctomycetota bacterium]